MKKILGIGLIMLIVIGGFLLARNVIAKAAVENGVRFITGLKLNMQSLDIGLAGTSLGIQDLRIFNPQGYQDKIMLDMPEIYVNYELKPFFQKRVHLEEIRVHLKEFVIVKNEKGELNLDSLKAVRSQKREAIAEKSGKPKAKEKGKAPDIQIDEFKLRIEQVYYKDYSRGGKPSVKKFNINLSESYSNITDPNAIVNLIVVKALMSTGLATLTNFDVSLLQSSLYDTLGSSRRIAAEAVTSAQGTLGLTAEQAKELIGSAPDDLKETAGKLGETTEGLTEDLSQTASALKEKLKLPFGKKESK
ncbi:MAG: hypothetical protein HY447_05505 [Candidatus Omnitrophica bacterium]|nr:hypothetical protein [Candidatus Omnitrophota bacterium]